MTTVLASQQEHPDCNAAELIAYQLPQCPQSTFQDACEDEESAGILDSCSTLRPTKALVQQEILIGQAASGSHNASMLGWLTLWQWHNSLPSPG